MEQQTRDKWEEEQQQRGGAAATELLALVRLGCWCWHSVEEGESNAGRTAAGSLAAWQPGSLGQPGQGRAERRGSHSAQGGRPTERRQRWSGRPSSVGGGTGGWKMPAARGVPWWMPPWWMRPCRRAALRPRPAATRQQQPAAASSRARSHQATPGTALPSTPPSSLLISKVGYPRTSLIAPPLLHALVRALAGAASSLQLNPPLSNSARRTLPVLRPESACPRAILLPTVTPSAWRSLARRPDRPRPSTLS